MVLYKIAVSQTEGGRPDRKPLQIPVALLSVRSVIFEQNIFWPKYVMYWLYEKSNGRIFVQFVYCMQCADKKQQQNKLARSLFTQKVHTNIHCTITGDLIS